MRCHKVLKVMRCTVLLFSLVAYGGVAWASPPVELPPQVNRPPLKLPDYTRSPESFVVLAEVLDLDVGVDKCFGIDCVPLPLLEVSVLAQFGGAVPESRLVLQVYQPGTPFGGSDPPRIGERLLITVRKETPPRQWTCGRLIACDANPTSVVFAQELFRKLEWPSGK